MTSLVAGGLGAVAISSGNASAAATVGTFTIGDSPVALNQPSDPEMGVLTPSADAAQNGMYGTQAPWPVIPLHIALARNGHLISYGTPLDAPWQGGLNFDDWDVSAGYVRSAHTDTTPMNDYNAFCNALAELPDGRMVMVGGNSTMSSMIYDPATRAQTMGSDLARQRWYASTLRLTDGRIIVLGGGNYYNTWAFQTPSDDSGVATTPEIGSGTGAWTSLSGATSAYAFGAEDNRWWYPRAFNGPNGTVVGFSGDHIWSLSTAGAGSVQALGTLPFNPRVSGSQVMYAPGRILIAGGGQNNNDDNAPATDRAATVDINGATPVVASTSSMTSARNWLNLTVMPTGEVFANGGTRVGMGLDGTGSVKQSEIWNPATGQWRTAATAQRTRTYHSTSLLMPSGAIFTGGGGAPGPEDNLNAELYYPSYLFTKAADGTVQWSSRPAITAIAGSATYGGDAALTIGDGRRITSASLISSPSVTHSENTDQRRIPLAITQNGATVTATLPASADVMPPGDYELSVVDANGVPSASQIVTIRQGGAGLVTVASADQVQNVVASAGTDGGATSGTAGGTPTESAPAPQGGPTAGAGPSSGATPSGSVPLTVDRSVGIESVDSSGHRIISSGSSVRMTAVGAESTTAAKSSSSWVVRTGLASSSGISFESVDTPGRYLAASSTGAGAMRYVKNDGTAHFAGLATFAPVTGATGQNTSFTVWAKRSLYLRHRGSSMITQSLDRSARGRADSTFAVRVGYTAALALRPTPGRAVGLEVADQLGHRVRHVGSTVTVTKVGATSSTTAKTASTWIVRRGLGSKRGVSFESRDRPGFFLVAPAHGSGKLKLLTRSRSAAFAARATFTLTAPGARATSIVVTAHRSLYLQRKGSALVVASADSAGGTHVAPAFVIRSGSSPARTR